MKETNMWECDSCGGVEYGGNPPGECEKCWKLDSFVKVEEDEVDAKREADLVEGIKKDFDEGEEIED